MQDFLQIVTIRKINKKVNHQRGYDEIQARKDRRSDLDVKENNHCKAPEQIPPIKKKGNEA